MYHTIDNAEDLDLVLAMYNLIEYSSNYSETAGRLWFFSKDADIENTDDFKSFKYKAKLIENTVAEITSGIIKNATIDADHLKCHWLIGK